MVMSSFSSVAERIHRLKAQQNNCMDLLMDCIKVREIHPEYAPRLDQVITSVERTMSQNADLLARLEAEARMTYSAVS